MRILIAIIIFSIIIVIHELGHFLLAKKNGIAVTEFSLGMGPRILSHQGKQTRYSLKLLPIGGSCMMLGEDELIDDDRAFNKKGVWARISVVIAGPLFNFILAFVLAIFLVGMVGYDPAFVTTVKEDFPAANAGMQQDDLITKINGTKITVGREFQTYLMFHPLSAKPVSITYKREGKSITTTVQPVLNKTYMLGFNYPVDSEVGVIDQVVEGYPLDEAGVKAGDVITKINDEVIEDVSDITAYFLEAPLGDKEVVLSYQRDGKEYTASVMPKMTEAYTLGLGYNTYRSGKETNPITVLKYSYVEVKYCIQSTIGGLGQLVTGKISKDDIAGPVGIVDMIGDSYEAGKQDGLLYIFLNIANLCIILSANLGVMNLLPIPALDGGRLVFLFIEAIRGKPVDQEKEGMVHLVGLIALMLLMVFVFFNDISRLIG